MSKKWLKWAKNCKKDSPEKELENLIEWLKLFYKSNEKEKNLILVKLHKENLGLYKFIDKVRNYNKEEQERLYEQIRGNFI